MFTVGMKVVCVEPINGLRKGGVYTVVRVSNGCRSCLLDVDCPHADRASAGWYSWRFRPLVSRQTDISVFQRMLTPAPKVDA